MVMMLRFDALLGWLSYRCLLLTAAAYLRRAGWVSPWEELERMAMIRWLVG